MKSNKKKPKKKIQTLVRLVLVLYTLHGFRQSKYVNNNIVNVNDRGVLVSTFTSDETICYNKLSGWWLLPSTATAFQKKSIFCVCTCGGAHMVRNADPYRTSHWMHVKYGGRPFPV